MADLNDLLGKLPVGDLAKQFGVDSDTMSSAIAKAVPGLLAGMATNASTAEGAEKLSAATQNHTKVASSISDIDIEDGKKIVKKVLGDKEDSVVKALGASANNSDVAALLPKLLPMLAPLLMQFLAGNKQSSSGGGITDILGGLLGGSSGSSGGGITDILGGILGGGNQSSSSGGLGGVIGGLLGGK